MIRCVEQQDKETWYALDRHLAGSELDEKVRCKQGYVCFEDVNDHDKGVGRRIICQQ